MARNIANKLAVSLDMLFGSKGAPGELALVVEVPLALGVPPGGIAKREVLGPPPSVGVAPTSEDSSEPTLSTVILILTWGDTALSNGTYCNTLQARCLIRLPANSGMYTVMVLLSSIGTDSQCNNSITSLSLDSLVCQQWNVHCHDAPVHEIGLSCRLPMALALALALAT
jgi:hypothetical protein